MIINGDAIAAAITQDITQKVAAMDTKPGLTVILVGDNPASQVYVRRKEKKCTEVGFNSQRIDLPAETTEAALLDVIKKCNNDDTVHGILVQLPLPAHINKEHIITAIAPEKDVDGLHPLNAGKLCTDQHGHVPCTPKGVMRMLKAEGINLKGKHAVVVGRSTLVGKPLALLLLQQHATVTVCHSHTQDLAAVTQQADILIAAVGKPRFITADMVKKGAIVIDVGINRVDDDSEKGYHLEGDVDFEQVQEKAAKITPVPGGVGPLTIAMLLENTLEATQ